ncbi:MAG TPA: RnfABCDGE type electron transport complex subunit D, partial [Candidatus Norongarragalinales archaeon]|nr:RnfABCDGE type electron transport complex subunit D [Candidatus Norongarragalinales archaeon]
MSPLLRGKFEKPYPLAPAPHLRAPFSVRKLFWGTSVALLPLWASAWVIFGWNAPRVVLFSIGFGILWESLVQLSRKSKINITDGSTVLASFLFALLMPPSVSIPMMGLGAFFTVVVGKEIFGGLGQNIFHPALVGYAVLAALFPDAFA